MKGFMSQKGFMKGFMRLINPIEGFIILLFFLQCSDIMTQEKKNGEIKDVVNNRQLHKHLCCFLSSSKHGLSGQYKYEIQSTDIHLIKVTSAVSLFFSRLI
jgi:hypothetical protein